MTWYTWGKTAKFICILHHTCSPIYTHNRHSTEKREKDSDPTRCDDSFDSTNPILRICSVYRTKRKSRCNHRDEHEKRNCNRFLVEVHHLRSPVSSNGTLEIINKTSTPGLRRICKGRQEKQVVEVSIWSSLIPYFHGHAVEVLPSVTFPASGMSSWLLFAILAVVIRYKDDIKRLDFEFVSLDGKTMRWRPKDVAGGICDDISKLREPNTSHERNFTAVSKETFLRSLVNNVRSSTRCHVLLYGVWLCVLIVVVVVTSFACWRKSDATHMSSSTTYSSLLHLSQSPYSSIYK